VRRVPGEDEPLSRVRMRAGSQLTVVDLSSAGALLEGTARFLPGTHIDVHIVTAEGRTLVRSRIVRAYVSNVAADRMQYRGAVAFDRQVPTAVAGYGVPEVLASVAAGVGQDAGVSPLPARPEAAECAQPLAAG
jgi:hypothetical protein